MRPERQAVSTGWNGWTVPGNLRPSPLRGSNIPAVTLNVADESLVSARELHDLAFRMTDGAEESVAMFVSDAVSASAPASHTVPVRSAPFDKTYNVTVTGDAVGQIAEQLSSSPENLALLDSLDGIIENGLYTGSRYEGGSLRLDTFETPVTVGGADKVVTFEARMNSSGVSTLSGLTVREGTAARDVPGLLAEIAAGKPMEPRLQRIAELTAGGRSDNAGMPARMETDGQYFGTSEFDALPSSMEIMANLTKEDAEAVTQTIIDDAVRAMQNAETGNLSIENQSGAGYNGDSFENRSVRNFDFNRYLRQQIGAPPERMVDPHAHHILFKEGNGAAQKALVQEGQALLRRHGIDPVYGLENLVWAPNRITGQHDIRALRNVVDQLKAVGSRGGDFYDIVDMLIELGEVAASRR